MKTIDKVRAAEVASTGKRFCSGHRGYADAATGQVLQVRGTARFVCGGCLMKRKAAAQRAAGAPPP